MIEDKTSERYLFMNKRKSKKVGLGKETVKTLTPDSLADAQGGGMCSTGAPTGMCCTQSDTCTHTK